MFELFWGAMLISWAPILFKTSELSPTAAAFYRLALATFALVLFFVVTRRKLSLFAMIRSRDSLLPSHLKWILVAGVAFALDLFCWHRSIEYVGAGLGTLLANTQVFYLLAFSLIIKEFKPNKLFYFSTILAFGGLALTLGEVPAWSSEKTFGWGVGLGFITGLNYATYIRALQRIRQMGKVQSLPELMLWSSASVTFFLAILLTMEGGWVWPEGWKQWTSAWGLAVPVHIGGWTLITIGLTKVPLAVSGIMILIQPLGSLVWSAFLFDEWLNFYQALGTGITLVGIYLAQRSRA